MPWHDGGCLLSPNCRWVEAAFGYGLLCVPRYDHSGHTPCILQLPPPSYTDQLAANIGGAAASGGQVNGGRRAALEQHAALDQHLEAELQRQQREHDILQRQLVRPPWPAPLPLHPCSCDHAPTCPVNLRRSPAGTAQLPLPYSSSS